MLGCIQVMAIQKYHSFFPKTIHFSTIQNFVSSFCICIKKQPIFERFLESDAHMLKNVNVSILCQVADKLGQCKNTIIFPKTIHFSKIQKSVSSFCICMYIRSPFLKFFEIWHPFAKNENFPILCQAAHKFMFTCFCLFLKCI